MWLVLLLVACTNVACTNGAWDLRYDAPRRCSGSARPGLISLRNVLTRRYSSLRSGGIYNCRSVRGAGSISEHAEGRALDLMTALGNPDAQRVADWLVAKARDLGIQSVIYRRRVWGYGRWNWRAYSGSNPHTDHIHVGMNLAGAAQVTDAMVEAALSGGAIPPPAPTPPPTPTTCRSGSRTGQCQDQSTCTTGDVVSNLCPGAFNIKCCLPRTAATPPPPPPPPPPAGSTACRDSAGNSGICKDVSTCTGTTKSNLCPGPASVKCCFASSAPPPPPPPPPAALEQCVRCLRPVFVRSRASTSGSIILTAMAGEEFSKSTESNGWYHLSNSRGSGWSYRSYWGSCSAGRSLTNNDDPQDGAAAAPRAGAEDSENGSIPVWMWVLVGFVAGVATVGLIGFAVVFYRKHAAGVDARSSGAEQPLMSDRPMGTGSWGVIPQLRGKTSKAGKRGSINVKK